MYPLKLDYEIIYHIDNISDNNCRFMKTVFDQVNYNAQSWNNQLQHAKHTQYIQCSHNQFRHHRVLSTMSL
jgi:hypothetical protein